MNAHINIEATDHNDFKNVNIAVKSQISSAHVMYFTQEWGVGSQRLVESSLAWGSVYVQRGAEGGWAAEVVFEGGKPREGRPAEGRVGSG